MFQLSALAVPLPPRVGGGWPPPGDFGRSGGWEGFLKVF